MVIVIGSSYCEGAYSATDCASFRPVNSELFQEKVLEGVVHQLLKNYIYMDNILVPNQSRFRQTHSCETSIQRVVSGWKRWLDVGGIVVLTVSLDVCRAYETLNRQLLLYKLQLIGLD